jgi:transaldolase
MNKNPVLAKAIEHFKHTDAEMKELHVEEWDTTIYYKEKSAFKDQSAIMQLHQKGKVVEALVETIVVRSLNQDGTKMFQPAERVHLLNSVDPNVLVKIATELNKVEDDYDLDETVKN